jgi:hypothetical protein
MPKLDPKAQANEIYLLKRYKVWVSDEAVGNGCPQKRMLPHTNCPPGEPCYSEAAVLSVLGYDPAERSLKYSKDGVGAVALSAEDKLQTLHQTLRNRGLNRLHVCCV